MSGRRKLKMQCRIKTPGSRKGKKTAKSRAITDSTQVSSPIRDKSRRRAATTSFDDEDEDEIDDHGYVRDGFVASDNEEDSDDGFAPIQYGATSMASALPRSKPRKLGPPITTNHHLAKANVTEAHGELIEAFVIEAKILDEKTRNGRNIKRPFFTERNFQEMALNWTTSLEEMKLIENINAEKVDHFGSKFLPLLKSYQRQYEEIMAQQKENLDMDQNHRNVINLCSDDEDDEVIPDEEDPEEEEDEVYDGETSKYFQTQVPQNVLAFNEDISQLTENANQKAPEPQPKKNTGSKEGGFKRSGRGAPRGRAKFNRRSSGGKSAGSAPSGVSKSTSSRKGSGSGSNRGGASSRGTSSKASSSKTAASKQGGDIRATFAKGKGGSGGGGAFSMMPT